MNLAAGLEFNRFALDILAGTSRDSQVSRDRYAVLGKAGASAPLVMTLDRWRTASLDADRTVEITCLSGQLWISRLGESEDVVLQDGQRHVLEKPVRDVVLSTVGAPSAATVGVRAVGTASPWQFLRRDGQRIHLTFA